MQLGRLARERATASLEAVEGYRKLAHLDGAAAPLVDIRRREIRFAADTSRTASASEPSFERQRSRMQALSR